MRLWISADGSDGTGIRYCMENNRGIQVEISALGAAVTRLMIPDKENHFRNVIFRYANSEAYKTNPIYAGATVAPVAGRIDGGRFFIGEQQYKVNCNEGDNCLHGGVRSGHIALWHVCRTEVQDDSALVELCLDMEDGREGFPGNRTFYACYRLEADARLTVTYRAVSDKDTYINMTNHMYFNCGGDFTRTAMNQRLMLNSDAYMENDARHLPGRRLPVQGTVMDFRESHSLKDVIEGGLEKGLDHAFDVRRAAREDDILAEIFSPESGCGVRLKSRTAQCVVAYTGGFIGNDHRVDNGEAVVNSSDFCAVALECQAFPNGINRPDLEPEVLKAGETYVHKIEYEFIQISN